MSILSHTSAKGALLSLIVIGLMTLLYALRPHKDIVEHDIALESLPYQLEEWQGKDTNQMTTLVRDILKLDRHVNRIYTNASGENVHLYVGYWKKQSGDYQAAKHSPQICLPANGWTIWGRTKTDVHISEDTALQSNVIFGDIRNFQSVFYYWFFSGERLYTEDWASLIYLTLEQLLHGRSDGGIVEISAELHNTTAGKESEQRAQKVAEDFIKAFYPEFQKLALAERR